jgi:hypothetical protein
VGKIGEIGPEPTYSDLEHVEPEVAHAGRIILVGVMDAIILTEERTAFDVCGLAA